MTFSNPSVDHSLPHQEPLLPEDTGVTGDITASRKVRVPLIPIEEFYLARKRGETPPEEWRNSLYLEWYTIKRGRCVLEAAGFEMLIEEAVWEMTAEEEAQSRADAARALGSFMDNLGSQIAPPGGLGGTSEMDEFDWEKFLRHTDSRTEKYGELLDKFGDDSPEIGAQMGWNKEHGEARFSDVELPDESDFADWEEPEPHPIELLAQEVLEGADWLLKESPGKQDLYSAIASVRVKIGGAMSMHEGAGVFEDNGFVIAYLKRALGLLDNAVALANKEAPVLVPKLLGLRSEVIDLQGDLRKRMS